MKIFGKNATMRQDVEENCLHRLRVGDIAVLVLRWEISDFEIDGLNLKNGHLISYRVIDGKKECNLFQHLGVFYAQEDIGSIEQKEGSIPQGDGQSRPLWHKCDRAWPVRASKEFEFVAQFYYDETVAYLFRDGGEGHGAYAIFNDDINRQDAEEHYRMEAELGAASNGDRSPR